MTFVGGLRSILAQIEFNKNENNKTLKAYAMSDLYVTNITGLTKKQLKTTIINANKFISHFDKKNMNFVILEVNDISGIDIDIMEALYGTEFDSITNNTWSRYPDGLFQGELFRKNVAGILVRKRKVRELICNDYINVLCLNPAINSSYIHSINAILKLEQILNYRERPNGGFFNVQI